MQLKWRAARAAVVMLVALAAGVGQALADTGPCGQPSGGALPDLTVDAKDLASFLSVSDEKFSPASCAVQEGMVSSPGWHALLRFSSSTPNLGAGALVIGDPAACTNLFEMSTCHGHLHFRQYADYRLWTPGGYDTWVAMRDLGAPANTGVNVAYLADAAKKKHLLASLKRGFCMIDSVRVSDTASPTPVFQSCSVNQGLSAGWGDRYDARLDGQYIEVDTLKEGLYVLEVHVNAEHLLPESDTTNNSSAVRVLYTPRRGSTPATIQVVP